MSVNFQVKSLKSDDGMETVWSKLVSRAVRVALARRDISYAQLAAELAKLGVTESARSVEGKVQRGTFRFSFFLQTLAASNADCPAQWIQALSAPAAWEKRAATVLATELSQQPWLSLSGLAHRLEEIGVAIPLETLSAQTADGTFSAAFFLQCATVCRFDSVHRFLDVSSMNSAALAGASNHSTP
ncbi:DUF6471 domain-containing protein [Caballeronia mineralivorans]|jgi:hypothetical protein|uniref:DUF6471 domain-containing protein n=1 Tax=Caballeronia mineralivorans TaxID=2010198 RepID=UPI002AFEAC91|nr:DUF6471 domain-containing protein [Caballeronia mineralivorans]